MPPCDTSPTRLKKLSQVLGLIALRMVGMVLVAMAMPLAHEKFGEAYPGDGQQAFGVLIFFWVIGFAAAIVYMLTATLAHFFVMKKSLPAKLWVEAGVLLAFISVLAYLGITAQYH